MEACLMEIDGLTDINEWDERRRTCCIRMMTEQPPGGGNVYCNITWDTWDCWNWTRVGETARQHCPSWIDGSDSNKFATKECMDDGFWFISKQSNKTWTNYMDCACPEEKNTFPLLVFYAGYVLSIIASALALFIFTHFKSLACPRVTIHKNLFTSFILCGLFNPFWHFMMSFNADSVCKLANVIASYFTICNYFWMLSEGLYLHTVIVVAVFSENHNLLFYYIVGWVVPLFPTAILTIFNITNDFPDCWTQGWTTWITGATVVCVILLNLGFLLNIVRVLVRKLRAIPSRGSMRGGYARAVRSTLILLPLMGLQWLIVPVQPAVCSVATVIYNIVLYFLISFQGFFVACIFCFFNGEVKMQIKRKWIPDKWRMRREFRKNHNTVTVMSLPVTGTIAPERTIQSTDGKKDNTEPYCQNNGSIF